MFKRFGTPTGALFGLLAPLACSSSGAVVGSDVQDSGADGSAHGGASGGNGVGGSGGAAGASGGSAQCGWQSGLDAVGCTAKRAYVECTYPSGASCAGLSDDPTTNTACGPTDPSCPSCVVDGGPICQNQCTAAEYGVACGSPGAPFVGEPVGCRLSLVTPGGVVFHCCPCL
jgi:hypothetical protein